MVARRCSVPAVQLLKVDMMPKPEKRTVTKVVHVEYWWCGDQDCTREHATEDTAARCTKANRGPKPEYKKRNEAIFQRMMIDGISAAEVGREFDLSGSRAAQCARKVARKRGLPWAYGDATLEQIRAAAKAALTSED
jgi:hypothetical protein